MIWCHFYDAECDRDRKITSKNVLSYVLYHQYWLSLYGVGALHASSLGQPSLWTHPQWLMDPQSQGPVHCNTETLLSHQGNCHQWFNLQHLLPHSLGFKTSCCRVSGWTYSTQESLVHRAKTHQSYDRPSTQPQLTPSLVSISSLVWWPHIWIACVTHHSDIKQLAKEL